MQLTKIRGKWFTGLQVLADGSLNGGLWTTQGKKVADFPDTNLDGVNSSGDVAYADEQGASFVERRDGSRYAIDATGFNTVSYLFERGGRYDAGGDRDYGFGRAVLWSGCSS